MKGWHGGVCLFFVVCGFMLHSPVIISFIEMNKRNIRKNGDFPCFLFVFLFIRCLAFLLMLSKCIFCNKIELYITHLMAVLFLVTSDQAEYMSIWGDCERFYAHIYLFIVRLVFFLSFLYCLHHCRRRLYGSSSNWTTYPLNHLPITYFSLFCYSIRVDSLSVF